MVRIGFWSRNDRLGQDAWVNLSTGARYRQVSVVKHPTKKEYAVSVWTKERQEYRMGVNSGTSAWYGMTKTKALELAREFMRRNP